MLDLFGSATSLLSTYFFIRLNKLAWLISLVAICLNGWLYYQKGIYADMMLEVVYFISTCYGLFLWRKPKSTSETPIQTLSIPQWGMLVGTIFILFVCVRSLLTSYTHSTVPSLDAITTSLSLVGQWLMCHKIITTWVIWFVTDIIYAFLYFQKQLPFHVGLMCVYTGLAIAGYWAWSRRLSTGDCIKSLNIYAVNLNRDR